MNQSPRKRSRTRRFAPYVLLAALIGFLMPGNGLIPGFGGPGDYSAVLRGQVLTSGNVPMQDVVIRVGQVSAKTDAEGRFEVRNADFLRKTVAIKVEKDGFFTKAINYRVASRRVDLGRLTLRRAFYLRGTLISQDMNAPIPAGKVRVVRTEAQGGNLEVETDADGGYFVGPVLEGVPFRLVIEHPAYLPTESAERRIENDDQNPPGRIVLSVGAVISGMARGPKREPLPAVQVFVYRMGADGKRGALEKAGLAGIDGSFLVQGLTEGRKLVIGDARDSRLVGLPVTLDLAKGGEVTGVEVSFAPRDRE